MSQLLEVPQCPCLSPLTQVFRKKGWAWRAVVHDRTWRTTSGWGSPVTSYSSELTLDNSSHSSPSSPVGQYCISVQSVSSVAQLCPTLCHPMDCSTPGLPVHHQLPEFTQTHVHKVSDVIQPSHPLLSPYPPTFNLFQHQVFFNKSVLSIR